MKRAVVFIWLIVSSLLLSSCAQSGTNSSAGISEASSTVSNAALSTEYSGSTETVTEGTANQEQIRFESAVEAEIYYYIYNVKTGTYTPSAKDEYAYWMSLDLYCSLMRDRKSAEISSEDGYSCISEENAGKALSIMFQDFDGTFLKSEPEKVNGAFYRDGKYYFAGGDFADDDVRLIVDTENTENSDGSRDIKAQHYHTGENTAAQSFTVHLVPADRNNNDEKDSAPCAVSFITAADAADSAASDHDNSSSAFSEDNGKETSNHSLHVTIGERSTKNYYYHDDPSQRLLVKEEKMLPIFTGGDSSIRTLQEMISHMSDDLDGYTLQAENDYLDDTKSSSGLESLLSKISFDDGRYVTLELLEQRYEGGAHGSQVFYEYVLDQEAGRRLLLSDVIENDENSFETIFQKYFNADETAQRAEKSAAEIMKETSLDEYRFYLADNGVVILFNRGEIGGTALGDVRISIPYSEMNLKISVGGNQQTDDMEGEYEYDL